MVKLIFVLFGRKNVLGYDGSLVVVAVGVEATVTGVLLVPFGVAAVKEHGAVIPGPIVMPPVVTEGERVALELRRVSVIPGVRTDAGDENMEAECGTVVAGCGAGDLDAGLRDVAGHVSVPMECVAGDRAVVVAGRVATEGDVTLELRKDVAVAEVVAVGIGSVAILGRMVVLMWRVMIGHVVDVLVLVAAVRGCVVVAVMMMVVMVPGLDPTAVVLVMIVVALGRGFEGREEEEVLAPGMAAGSDEVVDELVLGM